MMYRAAVALGNVLHEHHELMAIMARFGEYKDLAMQEVTDRTSSSGYSAKENAEHLYHELLCGAWPPEETK